jgi:hypothetical protein
LIYSGKRYFTRCVRLKPELVDERRFSRGVVVLRYVVHGCFEGVQNSRI